MPLFASTVLLSAALLFVMQPMIGKMLLPRLGGTPAVWNTCMVFFQVCLLAGYAYAHYLPRWLGARRHAALHVIVLCLAFLCLPLALRGSAQPQQSNPIGWLLLTLTLSAALPFFVVSTNAPLMQKWYSTSGNAGERDPYFLYAASNAGSLIGLLAYPLLIEPRLRVAQQARLWTGAYAVLVLLSAACVVVFWRARQREVPSLSETGETNDDVAPTWRQRLRWIALALVPSSYLLGVTTFITTDIAAVPLLWIVPLALYLLSFVLVFARRPIVPHHVMCNVLPATSLATVFLLLLRIAEPLWLVLGVHLLAFFVAAMVCHGELSRSRPPVARLTDFYLMIAIGGALGGAFNALLAPSLFTRPLEFPLAIVLACLLAPPRRSTDAPTESVERPRRRIVLDVALAALAGLCAWGAVALNRDQVSRDTATLILALIALSGVLCITFVMRPLRFALGVAAMLAVYAFVRIDRAQVYDIRRSFFGIHRVVRSSDGRFNELYHGTTLHGRQQVEVAGQPTAAHLALAYYHHTGPIGQLLTSVPPQRDDDIAVIGLGVGSLAAYAHPGTHMTFYEIDPAVRWAADDSGYFSFLSTARTRGAKVDVVLGDARLTLAGAPPHSFDIIVLDAFSGDAVPVHLLTREALAMYLDKLKPHGILAMHISNVYLDLEPVVAHLAGDAGCVCLTQFDPAIQIEQLAEGKIPSMWAAIARSPEDLEPLREMQGWKQRKPDASVGLWTDDFSNVVEVLRWWQAPH